MPAENQVLKDEGPILTTTSLQWYWQQQQQLACKPLPEGLATRADWQPTGQSQEMPAMMMWSDPCHATGIALLPGKTLPWPTIMPAS